MAKVDDILDQAVGCLGDMFAQIELTEEERRFVETFSRELHSHVFEKFCEYPGYGQLRPFCMALTTAMLIGPGAVWGDGIAGLLRSRQQ